MEHAGSHPHHRDVLQAARASSRTHDGDCFRRSSPQLVRRTFLPPRSLADSRFHRVWKDDANNFLVGYRGSSTLVYISGSTGEVLWKLGGEHSDFELHEWARFNFQHNAKIIGSGTKDIFLISLFDNSANQRVEFCYDGREAGANRSLLLHRYEQRAGEARGVLLRVNKTTMKVTLEQAFWPSFHGIATSEGSVQLLPNGNVVVGWGIVPYYSGES